MNLTTLPFWRLEYHAVSPLRFWRIAWQWAVGGLVGGVLAFGLGEAIRLGLGNLLMLVVLWATHLFARGYLETRARERTFAEDLRTGNLDQLRLLRFTPHELILQRALPRHLLLWRAMPVWLPVYALWALLSGLSWTEGVLYWALTSFAPYPLLWVAMVVAMMPWMAGWSPLAVLVLWGTLWVREWGRYRPQRSELFGSRVVAVIVMLLLLIPVVFRENASPLPALELFFVGWLAAEGLRYERLARWLNPPSGWGRFWWLVASAGVLSVGFGAVWSIGSLFPISDAERWGFASAGVIALAGYLSLLLLPFTRGRDPVQQPFSVHGKEQAGLYALALGVLALGSLWVGQGVGSGAFWLSAVLIAVMEGVGGGLFRTLAQRAWHTDRRVVFGALLIGLLPIIGFLLFFARVPVVGLASPTGAMLAQTPAWNALGAPAGIGGWGILLVGLRWLVVLSLLGMEGLRSPIVATVGSASHVLLRGLLTVLMGYPLLDGIIQRTVANPVLRLTLQARHFDGAPVAGFAILLLSLAPPQFLRVTGGIIPFLLALGLWYWGYQRAWRQVRMVIESEELHQWFLARMELPTLFWGWVLGVWYQQVRVVVAMLMGFFWGSVMSALVGGGSLVAVLLSLVPVGLLAVVSAFIWLTAAPAGVRDALVVPTSATATRLVSAPTWFKALGFSSVGCLCALLSPLLLTLIPYYYSESLKTLRVWERGAGR